MSDPVTADLILHGYQRGAFPMAVPEEGNRIFWFSPDPRGIVPLDEFRIPRSVRRFLRESELETTVDRDFAAVIRGCADRPQTWISVEMERLYRELHARGYAHSVEVWSGQELAGGLYGVALGGAFFGESMFSAVPNASKVALVDLVRRLVRGAFQLLDTQYLTPHLEHFGGIEVDRSEFLSMLDEALAVRSNWPTSPGPLPD